MIELFLKHFSPLSVAFFESNFMLWTSMFFCLLFSLPLGFLLFALQKNYLYKNVFLHHLLSLFLNMLRSVPFLIFIFLLIPLTRFLFKTSFGNVAATFPLTLVGVSLYTRFIEQALLSVPTSIVDRAMSMGANKYQILRYFLLPSIKIDLVLSFVSVAISLLSYSTVMGVIGAGGLGEYAYRYGYQEYDYPLMYLVVAIFVLYVYLLQILGYTLAKYFQK